MRDARRQHSRVEITADRTAFSQTFANPNGTTTYVASAKPRWVARGESGSGRTLTWCGTGPGTGRAVPGGGREWPAAVRRWHPGAGHGPVRPALDVRVLAGPPAGAAHLRGHRDLSRCVPPGSTGADRTSLRGLRGDAGGAQRRGRPGSPAQQHRADPVVEQGPGAVCAPRRHRGGARRCGQGHLLLAARGGLGLGGRGGTGSGSSVAGPGRGAHLVAVPTSYGPDSVRMRVRPGCCPARAPCSRSMWTLRTR